MYHILAGTRRGLGLWRWLCSYKPIHSDIQGFQRGHRSSRRLCLGCMNRHSCMQKEQIHTNRRLCLLSHRSCKQRGPNIRKQCKNRCRCHRLPIHCSCRLLGPCNRPLQKDRTHCHHPCQRGSCHHNRSRDQGMCSLPTGSLSRHSCKHLGSNIRRRKCIHSCHRLNWHPRRSCKQWQRCTQGTHNPRCLVLHFRRSWQLQGPSNHSKIQNQCK